MTLTDYYDNLTAEQYDSQQTNSQQLHTYHHSQFASDLIKDTYKGALYAYTLEHDIQNDVWELTIHSTSLSELDDDDEILECYNYQDKAEALQDIETATAHHKIDFEEI